MIVGEAPGETEILRGIPFCGVSGWELDRMLREAGIDRSQCFVTNVCNERPPGNDMGEWLVNLKNAPKDDSTKYSNKSWVPWKGVWCHPAVPRGYEALVKHIALVRPTLIIALGNTALFALTGKFGIKSWRGSQLEATVGGHTCKVIPAYHPAAVLRDWSTRAITVLDFKRAKREVDKPLPYDRPIYPRIIRPSFAQVVQWLGKVRVKLACGRVESSTDIETRKGHTACIGFHIRGLPTICIPWMTVAAPYHYWSESEEIWIRQELSELMTHPNFKIIGQNWFYDAQYEYRYQFVKLLAYWDTMIAEHCMYPGQPKSLDYISSKYNFFYRYWKDDSKNWDPKLGEDQLWAYNCDDTENTFEVYEVQKSVIQRDERLSRVWDFQTNTLGPLLFRAMCRGIRADVRNKARLSQELASEIDVREKWIQFVAGHPLNFRSPAQLKRFFYDDLKEPKVFNRKAKTPAATLDDKALTLIAKRNPLLRDFCRTLQELRSIGVFKSTFVEARLDRDQRIRCSFNIGGTVSFRLSSSENAFDSGFNLQNVPSGNEDPDPGDLELPNIRKLFIPDEGKVLFDIDLKNADFYTVVWESDDELFRLALEAGVDMHLLNAGVLFPAAAECTLERLKDPDFTKYAKAKYVKPRAFAKVWVHGTDYGGGDRTMAGNAGITVAENKRYREKWFGEHPGIRAWHERTEKQVKEHGYVENKFGYRWNIFDRLDGILPEALAWVPQSTTGCVINRAWDNIDRLYRSRDLEVLIQVHDSLVGQFPAELSSELLPAIPEAAKIIVPYDRPMVIPVGLKSSAVSWGHCA